MGREGDIDNGERNLVESGKKKRLGTKGSSQSNGFTTVLTIRFGKDCSSTFSFLHDFDLLVS